MNNNTDIPLALVTGGARRVGEAIVRDLHSQGYRVVIHCHSSLDLANQLRDELNAIRADSAWVLQADLGSLEEINKLCAIFKKQFQRCDLLINNASSFYATELGAASEQHWQDLFDTNAKAPFFICQAMKNCLPTGSNIINIADIYALRPLKNHTIYCMAKAANVMLTKSLALELAPEVRVNGIAPGAILWPEAESNDVQKKLKPVPLNSTGGVSAITEAVNFIVKAHYVTGQVINVDGGRTLNL